MSFQRGFSLPWAWNARRVWVLALAVRLAVVGWAASRIPPAADGVFYHTIAGRIARGLGYTWLWPDGVVTNAGHYPIGYPALVGAVYALSGPTPPAAMLLNALVGSLAAACAYKLAERAGGPRQAAIAGVLVALHPGLVAYTPALMTEGITASLLMCAAYAASAAYGRVKEAEAGWRRGLGWVIATGVLSGLATLVRPQSLLLAPVFGWLSLPRERGLAKRLSGAALALVTALLVCAPWTVRNCIEMRSCALVSHNGGWNLLIGTDQTANGTYAELKVPDECREVFDEAKKDACFGAAARRTIAGGPWAWVTLAPKKLAATFDYAGAGGWYLHAANKEAFPDRARIAVGAIETVFERLVLLVALLCSIRAALFGRRTELARRRVRFAALAGLGVIGLASVFTLHAWVGYVALGVLLLFWARAKVVPAPSDPASPRPVSARSPVLPIATAAVLLSLATVHVIFFGAGRYSLVAFPFVTSVAALAFVRRQK